MATSLSQTQVPSSTLVVGSSFMSKIHHLHHYFVSNNSIEVNLLECVEKEEFMFEKLEGLQHTETETPAGRIAATLQDKTIKLLNRRR